MGNPRVDEMNHTYGFLTVIGESRTKDNRFGWICECGLCGNKKVIRGPDLRKGKYTSCGCKQQTVLLEKPGTIYGSLEVIKRDPTPASNFPDKCVHWLCKCHNCERPDLVSISGKNLRNGSTSSCGCIKSKGELEIGKILNEKGLIFEREFSFLDLYGEEGKNKKLLRFDFLVKDCKNKPLFLIEFNGGQHYSPVAYFSSDGDGGIAKLERQKKYDELKELYCLRNKYLLYVIENPDSEKGEKFIQKLNVLVDYILQDYKTMEENKNVKVSYLNLRDISCG